MACSKFTVLLLVFTASLCTSWRFSTCSFQNSCWWTRVDDELKGEKSAHILSLPLFCSQASSLLAPTVIVQPLHTNVVVPSSNLTPSSTLPVISNTPINYAASKATDLYSPVPRTGITRSYFEWMASTVSLLVVMATFTIPLFVWMLSLPLISYLTTSSICENMLSVSPSLQIIAKKKIKEMEELRK